MAARVKVKTVRKTLENSDVQELFQQAVGGGDGALALKVVWPKFKQLSQAVLSSIKTIEWIVNRLWMKLLFPEETEAIVIYLGSLRDEFVEHFIENVPDLDRYLDDLTRRMVETDETKEMKLKVAPNFEIIPDEEIKQFTNAYKKATDCDLVNTLIVICNNLSVDKVHLENADKLSPKFLLTAGMKYTPFPEMPAANFKTFYNHPELISTEKELILYFLHKVYKKTYKVYEVLSMPDVDVEDFIKVVTSSIEQVEKHMGDCKEALAKLKSSVQLLRNNFGGYIRDVKESGNAGLMMENFVLDVSKNSGDVSPKIKAQFHKIIKHYRKQASMMPKDSKAQSLFSEVEKNFKELDRLQRTSPGSAAAEEGETLEPADEPENEQGHPSAAAKMPEDRGDYEALFAVATTVDASNLASARRDAMDDTINSSSLAGMKPSNLAMSLN